MSTDTPVTDSWLARAGLARTVGWLPWCGLFALAAALTFQKIRSFDYWWHLRTGQLIAESGRVPRLDPFTYTVPGERWVDIHWLHQLLLHAAHSLGGHDGVVVLKMLAALAVTALLATSGGRWQRPWVSVPPIVMTLLLAGDRFMPRPELISFVCLAAVLALFHRYPRRPDAWIYAVVPIQLIWTNSHGLFAVGLAVAGMAVAAELLRPLVSPDQPLRRARLRRLGAVFALAAGVAIANPNGLDGALYPLQQLDMIGSAEDRGMFGASIVELTPPLAESGREARLPLLFLFGGLAGVSLFAMLLNWRRLQTLDVLLWAAFLYLALGAQRNMALFAIAAAPLAVRNANEWLDARRSGSWPSGSVPATTAVSLGLALLSFGLAADAASGRLYERLGVHRAAGFGVMDVMHPVGAADWIARHRPEGPLCHHMADGGYLIWRLYPDYPVMADGRLEIYGAERFFDLLYDSPDSFRAVDERFACGVVVLRYGFVRSIDLMRWLYFHPTWQLAFVDEAAVLFTRAPRAGRIRRIEVDIDAPDLFKHPLADPSGDRSNGVEPGVEDMVRRMSRSVFLGALKRFEPALALLDESLSLYPDAPRGRLLRVVLLQQSGRPEQAERALGELLADRPGDPELHLHAGDLRFAAGRFDAARDHYEQALENRAGYAPALQRLGSVAEVQGNPVEAARLYMQTVRDGHPADPSVAAAVMRLRILGGGS